MEICEVNNTIDDEGSKQEKNSDLSSDGSDVSEPARLRHPILYGVESDWGFLCNYHIYFLPIISIIIWGIFLFT